MPDINKHKFFLISVLKDIYSDIELAASLGFKGGTAQMLFYELPRFSVDLDFNLLNRDKSISVYNKIKSILLKYGTIKDEADKYFGLLLVMDYDAFERNLKIEISNREFADSYEIKNYLGIPMNVMIKPDMFAHKLCALLDRKIFTNRDIFDIYYFMNQKTPVNKFIVEKRMNREFIEYLDLCIAKVESINSKTLLNGLGELVDTGLKEFVKTRLKPETIKLMKMYRKFPLFS
ncbi:MAG: nucleotidyl transferase AbiEii/AbiGii toxin family protein [Bacteroidales bacterium]|nr:nucleotidyl transferase AbiEii/AbiGii toxin family protein [Bacteroidales bacterium]